MRKFFLFLLFFYACSRPETVVKQEAKIFEDYGTLSDNGIVVTTTDSSLKKFNLNFYTEESYKSKIIIFQPEKNVIVEEKTNMNLHHVEINQYDELTVFQLLNSSELLNKKIVKITVPKRLPYKIGVYGGYIENEEKYLKFAKNFGDELPVCVINTGNLTKNSKNMTYWTKFVNNSQDFMVNSIFMPALSEQDVINKDFIYNFFAFDNGIRVYNYNSLKIISIDEGINLKKDSQELKKIDNELAGFSEWKIVVLNKNPFINFDKDLNENLLPILEKNKVVLFTGGKKGYERYIKNNITYVALSFNENKVDKQDKNFLVKAIDNEAFVILEVTRKRLLFKVYNIDKQLIDEFQVIE
ncbi:MAG: hypothetical protein N2258_02300 [Brevinematales bacterium]|nr:hypothetical protein [Brevinematales bacterium]